MKKKLIIGITGGFGTGKSTVAGMFGKLGACVIDADRLAQKLLVPGKDAYEGIVSAFGKGVLKKNGIIQRSRLAGLVFHSKSKLKILNSLIHPQVIKEIRKIAREAKEDIVIVDAPLLAEAGLAHSMDKLIVVKTDRDTQLKRLRKKGFPAGDIKQRIRCQLPLARKIKMADFIIDNTGTRNSTRIKVRKIWKEIRNGKD